jgi:hypothetical protein
VEKSDLWHLAIVPAEPGRFVSHIGADVRVSPTSGRYDAGTSTRGQRQVRTFGCALLAR